MHIINLENNFLAGDDGERITVIVRSQNTVHMVATNLDGVAGVMPNSGPNSSQMSFTLNKAANDPSMLLLGVFFANTVGVNGQYRVLVTGSNGGATFGKIIDQDGTTHQSLPLAFDVI